MTKQQTLTARVEPEKHFQNIFGQTIHVDGLRLDKDCVHIHKGKISQEIKNLIKNNFLIEVDPSNSDEVL